MDIKKWSEEELTSTHEKLDAWCQKYANTKWGGTMWFVTGLLGAFALSTGVVFIFFDGMTVMSFVLMVLGGITCFSWYKSEQQRKKNREFLEELRKEITRRTKRKEENPAN